MAKPTASRIAGGMTILPSGGEAAGRCRQHRRRGSEQSLHSAPHRVHEQCGTRAGLGGRGRGGGLACPAAVAFGPKGGNDRPPVLERDVPQLLSLRPSQPTQRAVASDSSAR